MKLVALSLTLLSLSACAILKPGIVENEIVVADLIWVKLIPENDDWPIHVLPDGSEEILISNGCGKAVARFRNERFANFEVVVATGEHIEVIRQVSGVGSPGGSVCGPGPAIEEGAVAASESDPSSGERSPG